MPRKFTETTLVLASHNTGKIKELAELLSPFKVDVSGGPDFQLAEPVEDGNSFIANAEIKSRYFAGHTGLPSLADDSGLVVAGLDGAPGIYSARWGGENKDFTLAMGRVAHELQEKGLEPEGQPAYFACALALTWPDGHTETVEGQVHGTLTFPPRGTDGFGYDPIFTPQGHEVTFAEMDRSSKQQISHRADAFRQLIARCFG